MLPLFLLLLMIDTFNGLQKNDGSLTFRDVAEPVIVEDKKNIIDGGARTGFDLISLDDRHQDTGSGPVIDNPHPDVDTSTGDVDNSNFGEQGVGNDHYTVDQDLALSTLWRDILNLLMNGSYQYEPFDLINGNSYLHVLENVLSRVNNLFDKLDLDSKYAGAQLEFLEKVANVAHSYIDNIFSQLLNYQSWYLQQEYNSPINQLKRLEEAGLSSAFFFGGFSNTAGSVGSGGGGLSSNPATAAMSNAGQAYEQQRASKRASLSSLFGTLADTSVNLLNAGINSQKTIAEANNIRLMTPLEMANAVADFQNKGVIRNYTQTQSDVLESSEFRNWFKDVRDTQFQAVENARENYKVATSDSSSARDFGSIWVDEQVYTGKVVYKDGHSEFKDFTRDQLTDSALHGGYTEDGGRIQGAEKWNFNLHGDVKGKAALGLGGGLGVSAENNFGGSLDYGRSSLNEKTHKLGTNFQSGKVSLNDIGHYSENGNSFKIGDTSFSISTQHRRLDTDKYKTFMTDNRDMLVNANRHYNLLTNPDLGAWLRGLHFYTKNFANGLKFWQKLDFDRNLYQRYKPQTMVGD